jgi:hypothetical protein
MNLEVPAIDSVRDERDASDDRLGTGLKILDWEKLYVGF